MRRNWQRLQDAGRRAVERYRRLGWKGKAVLWLWFGLYLFAGIVTLVVGPDKVFAWLASLADGIRSLPYAWSIFLSITVLLSFPPMIGFGTAQTLVGFALGFWPGLLVSAASCLLGSAVAFMRLIRFFASSVSRYPAFQALSQAVASKGLLLIVLLRLCPLPFSYSNASFASIETVKLFQFMVGTCVLLPKVSLYVFIGDRMYKFADPDSRGEMDILSKWLNAASIVVSVVLAVGASYYVYQITVRHVSRSQSVEVSDDEGEAGGNLAPEDSTSDSRSSDLDSSSLEELSDDEAGRRRADGSVRTGGKTGVRRSMERSDSSKDSDDSSEKVLSSRDYGVQRSALRR